MNTDIFFLLYNMTHRSNIFDRIVFLVAEYGDIIMIVVTAIALGIFFIHDKDWKRRRWIQWSKEVFTIGIAVGIPWAITIALKAIFRAPRPFVTFSQVHPLVTETPFTSFPSGHATVFFALAIVIWLFHRKLGNFFFLCATIIALSRVISGVHYPIDILAGASIGISFAFLSTIFLSKNK